MFIDILSIAYLDRWTNGFEEEKTENINIFLICWKQLKNNFQQYLIEDIELD